MALIKCPECGKEISDKAPACPNCGCPIAKDKTVKIKFIRFNDYWRYRPCDVKVSCGDKVLWTGRCTTNASFEIDGPCEVKILLKNAYGIVFTPKDIVFPAKIEPGKKYEMKCTGKRILPDGTKVGFDLSPVDVIDSEI